MEPSGLLAGVGHWGEQQLQIFLGVAEGALTTLHGLTGVVDVLALGQLTQFHGVAFHPLAVGVLAGKSLLDFLVGDDATLVGVDEEHLARFQTALGDDMLLGDFRQHTGFGREYDITIVGDLPTSRRKPLRSSRAPTWVPSVKMMCAGPSHGSISVLLYS